jgi:deoxyadenosine/deoxycytidine kinase
MALYDRIYQMLKVRTTKPDLVVYLQARTEVLLERIRKRGRAEEKPIRAEYVAEVAQAYADFFFLYDEGPLLIVNASDIDFVGNEDHRRELIEVIDNARAGTNHWSRG